MLAPIDDPVMADFVNNLDRINALAEQSPGFIWRLAEDNNNATAINIFNNEFLIINMSVWDNKESLFNFTYNSAHVEIFKRRKEWFSKIDSMHMALWFVKKGTIPTTDEAKERLNYFNLHGETPYAFTYKSYFNASDAASYHILT